MNCDLERNFAEFFAGIGLMRIGLKRAGLAGNYFPTFESMLLIPQRIATREKLILAGLYLCAHHFSPARSSFVNLRTVTI
jgi:hypothetical protein